MQNVAHGTFGDYKCIDSFNIRIVMLSCISVILPINHQISVAVLHQFACNLEIVIPNHAL